MSPSEMKKKKHFCKFQAKVIAMHCAEAMHTGFTQDLCCIMGNNYIVYYLGNIIHPVRITNAPQSALCSDQGTNSDMCVTSWNEIYRVLKFMQMYFGMQSKFDPWYPKWTMLNVTINGKRKTATCLC